MYDRFRCVCPHCGEKLAREIVHGCVFILRVSHLILVVMGDD